ncbi:MAG: NAD(P)/FAD-dependent oxidoreductase [Acutalibacteraceae bacterium]|nr:NAD(P)/FAD-dependent oxidoreductase [Acutalibacteraceae bacterium]
MKTVVIIGAGPAGLTSAYQLLKDNNDVRIFIIEKSSQVGGISKTVNHNGNRIDLGGHRFFSKDENINKIWLDILNLQGVTISSEIEVPQMCSYSGDADPNNSNDVMLLRRRVSRIYYDGKFFDYPVSLDMDTLKKLGFATSIKCAFGYLWSCLFKRKGDSLEDFYINRFGKPLYNLFFKEYTTKLWGVSPALLDSSWGAQRVKKLSLFKMVYDFIAKSLNKNYKTNDTSLIEQFYYPKFGPGQLWEGMANRIEANGGTIFYNTVCSRIFIENNKIKSVGLRTADNTEKIIDCDYLISSMPIKDLVSTLSIDVPEKITKVSTELPYRDFITVGVLIDQLKLKNATKFKTLNDIPPDCWIYVQDGSVKVGRIQIFNNWSPFMVKEPQKNVWIGLEYFCSEQDDFWKSSDSDIASFALNELDSMGVLDKNNVIDAVVLRQEKAYPAYFGTYKDFSLVKEYLNKFENLVCVGRNGQHRYNNMDHSMLTGIYASKYINGNISIDKVWNVNVEQDYHEEGSEKK